MNRIMKEKVLVGGRQPFSRLAGGDRVSGRGGPGAGALGVNFAQSPIVFCGLSVENFYFNSKNVEGAENPTIKLPKIDL